MPKMEAMISSIGGFSTVIFATPLAISQRIALSMVIYGYPPTAGRIYGDFSSLFLGHLQVLGIFKTHGDYFPVQVMIFKVFYRLIGLSCPGQLQQHAYIFVPHLPHRDWSGKSLFPAHDSYVNELADACLTTTSSPMVGSSRKYIRLMQQGSRHFTPDSLSQG